MLGIGTLLFPDLEKIRSRASQGAKECLERWDVPRGSDVPAHLKDEAPRFFKTRDGFRTTSRLGIGETLAGTNSVVQVALHAMSASFLAILGLISLVSPLLALLFLVPIFVLYFVTNSDGAGRFSLMIFVTLLGNNILAAYVGGLAIPGLYFLLALLYAFVPLLLDIEFGAERESDLLKQSMQFSGESAENKSVLFETHIEARKAQYEAAIKDTSPIWQIGTARGVFARTSQDGFASDAGLPFSMTLKDLQESHLWAYGTTGTGKTSGVLRKVLQFWIDQNAGGALIADGKGNLGREIGMLPNVQVIRPNHTEFALIQGLNAEEVTAVFAISNGRANSGSNGDFFINSGANLLMKSLIVLENACKLDAPAYSWTLANGLKMVTDKEFRDSAIEALKDSGQFDDELYSASFLSAAINFFGNEWPALAPETASGVTGQVLAWVNPLLSNRHLYKWASTAEGFDVTSVLTGSIVALDTSPAIYGPAGILVMQLAKARIYRALKQRSDNWRQEVQGQTQQRHVLILIDEAQELISEAEEGTMLAIGRSLGACFCMAAQSYDSLVARFLVTGGSREGALAMRANFKSVICFKSSPSTISDDIRPLLGSNMRRVAFSKNEGIAYDAVARSLIESGSLRPRSRLLRWTARFSTPSALVGTVWGGIKPRMTDAKSDADGEAAEIVAEGQEPKTSFGMTTGYTMEVKPVLDIGEEMTLNESFVAICQVQVAGCIRRDVVKITPQFAF